MLRIWHVKPVKVTVSNFVETRDAKTCDRINFTVPVVRVITRRAICPKFSWTSVELEKSISTVMTFKSNIPFSYSWELNWLC
ncbi:hypothetical protein RclHR1_10240003 [Rhizophagus clarus]|uniref:Uncharacterized protein n=1 Tax=Rhizophagus clarus TaxID=94130 RepID=A0A2Z6Q5M6_9GLOM|nr:hypothetical protein RclHR1_10240003 [Rhizophagus clarus]GES95627.1 hypothetical protein RCL_e1453_RclHR1_10240003 [Rhizophagus clarus]